MFYVSEELRQVIENIQRNAFFSLNADPEEVCKRNAEKNKLNDSEKESLETRYSKMKIEDFYAMMPEHPYDTSFEFYKFTRLCSVTKFDQPPFLRRFANIMALCHEFYTEGNPA